MKLFIKYLIMVFLLIGSHLHADEEQEKSAPPFPLVKVTLSELEKAIVKNDIELVKQLIKQGASVSAKDPSLGFPLLYAVQTNNPVIVELLLKNGADPNQKNKAGLTALFYAINWNLISIVQLLLKYKVDLHYTINGATVLDVAQQQGFFYIMRLLHEHGLQITPLPKLPPKDSSQNP